MATMESKIRYLQEKLSNTEDPAKRLKILHRLDSLPITIELLQATGIGKTVNGLRKQNGEVGEQARALVQKWKGMVPADGIIIPVKQPEKPKEIIKNVSEELPAKKPKVQEEFPKKPKVESNSLSHNKVKQAVVKKEKHRDSKETVPVHAEQKVQVKPLNNGGQRSSLDQSDRSSSHQGHKSSEGHHQRSLQNKPIKSEHSNMKVLDVKKEKKGLKEEDDIETYVKEYQHGKKEHSSKPLSSQKHSHKITNREALTPNSASVKESLSVVPRKVSNSISKSSHSEKSEKLSSTHVKHESKGYNQVTVERPKVKPVMKEKPQAKETVSEKKSKISFSEPKGDSFGSDNEDFDEPSQSFEDYLNYDLPVKVKKKKIKKPPVPVSLKRGNHSGTKNLKSTEKETNKSHHTTIPGAEQSKHKHHKHHSKEHKGERSHSGHGSQGSDSHKDKARSHKHDKEKRRRSSDDLDGKTSSKKQRISDPPLASPTLPDNPLSLPEIQPNYRPLRLPPPDLDMSPHKRRAHGLEDAAHATFQKNTRTQVYSGRRSHYLTEVPTLFDSCMQILCDNIDALEELGGVPYDIIKPVLDKCTPEQLCYLEEQNPYLMEDTDSLWQLHCTRDFRTAQRDTESFEAWRELYLRKHEEREERLKSITAKVSASWAGKPQGRTTKLAYLDGPVKPPRDVRRKQEKLGTAGPHSQHKPVSSLSRKQPVVKKIRPAVSTSAHSSSMLSSSGPDIGTGTGASGSSGTGGSSGGRQAKAKPAPMMQKAMKLMKGKYLAPFRCPFRR